MIIKSRKIIIKVKNDQIRQRIKFAWFPTRMKLSIEDKYGEIIWLEKYIIFEKYQHSPYDSIKGWKLHQKVRISDATIEKLSE